MPQIKLLDGKKIDFVKSNPLIDFVKGIFFPSNN